MAFGVPHTNLIEQAERIPSGFSCRDAAGPSWRRRGPHLFFVAEDHHSARISPRSDPPPDIPESMAYITGHRRGGLPIRGISIKTRRKERASRFQLPT